MTKKVLLIVAHEGFQPIEYGEPKRILEEGGISVETGSDREGYAKAAYEDYIAKVDITVNNAKAENYDGVFLIGGPGALEHLDNKDTYNLMRQTVALGKIWGAICISPRILAKAGLLQGKKATGWNGDDELGGILSGVGAAYLREGVIVDEKLITADGPASAVDFGEKIIESLK